MSLTGAAVNPNEAPQAEDMPGRGTPLRTYRLGDTTWQRFGEAAKAVGMTRAELVRAFIRWFLRYPGAELPERPELRKD